MNDLVLTMLYIHTLDFTFEIIIIALSKHMIAFGKPVIRGKKIEIIVRKWFARLVQILQQHVFRASNHSSMPYLFVTWRNRIKFGNNLFCKGCHNLQRFCKNMFQNFNNKKKALQKYIQWYWSVKHDTKILHKTSKHDTKILCKTSKNRKIRFKVRE